MYTEYDYLSSKEKFCYEKLLATMKRYALTVKLEGVDVNTIQKAMKAVLCDHPEIFWLSGSTTYTTTLVNRVVKDITVEMELARGLRLVELPSMVQRLEHAVDAIVKQAGKYSSTYGIVRTVHDCIIDTTDYVEVKDLCYTAYGCLINRKAVCSGYAKAFMLIMRRLGFACGYASGWGRTSGVSHAWNYIRLEGQFYFIDVTWDDPRVDTSVPAHDNKSWDYFCLTTEELLKTHRLSDEYHVPACNGTKYDHYRYNGAYLQRYSFTAVLPIATEQLRQGDRFSIKFATTAEANRAYTDLITNGKVFHIPGLRGTVYHSLSKSGLILTVNK